MAETRFEPMRSVVPRAAAFLAGAFTTMGAALVIVAVTTGVSPFVGYVSEAGVTAEPTAPGFRAGMLCLAAGLILQGAALWPITRLGSGLLAFGGGTGAVSGGVSCTDGCPLPPHGAFTTADLIHGGASMLAVGACTVALLAVATSNGAEPLPRLSRVAFWVVAPLVAATGVAMLAVGRDTMTGLLERAALTALLAWVLASAALLAFPQSGSAWTEAPPALPWPER